MAISVDGFSYTGTNVNALVANVPVGTTQSDLLLAWWVTRAVRSSANMTIPAGWTELGFQQASGSSPSTKVLVKVWNTGDNTAYTFTNTGNPNQGVSMLRISGINTGTFATGGRIQFGAHRDGTRTSGTVNSIVVSTPNSMLFHGGGLNLNGASFIPPDGMTEDFDAFAVIGATAVTAQSMNHQDISASGSTGDKTTVYLNAAQFVGFLWWAEPAPSASNVTVNLSTLSITGSAIPLTVVPGTVTVPINTLGLTGSAISLTVVPGAMSVGLSTLGLTGSAHGLVVIPGTVSIPLVSLGLTGSVHSLSVVPGAVTVPLTSLGLTGSVYPLNVTFEVFVSLSTLRLTGSANSLTVVPGTAFIPLNTLGMSGSVIGLSVVPGGTTTILDTLGLVATVVDLSVFIPSGIVSNKRIFHVAYENRTIVYALDEFRVMNDNRDMVIEEVE